MLNLKVTLTTVAEFYNEDNNTINHHGFKRKVGVGIEEEKVIRFARDFSHKSIFQASIRNEIKKKIAKIIGWYHSKYSASLES